MVAKTTQLPAFLWRKHPYLCQELVFCSEILLQKFSTIARSLNFQ